MNADMLVRIRGFNDTAPAFRQVVDDANRVGTTVARQGTAMVRSTQGVAMQTGNLAAQFNDIAVQLAQPGTSPFLIAIQQGTQISQVIGPMGATGAVKALGTALTSLLNPINLVTIGVIAAGGFVVQWLMSLGDASESAGKSLAEQAAPVDSLKGKISELQSITDAYAKAIRGTAKDQGIATDAIIANSEREFNAKKALLELELKRQQAAIAVQRAEIGKLGQDLKKSINVPANALDSGILEMGGYSDPKIGQFVRSPAQDALLGTTQAFIDQSGISDKLAELRANLTLAEIGTEGLEAALKTTFSEGVATSIERVGKAGASEAEKMSGRYQDLVSDMRQRIALSRVEQDTIGMSREELSRLRIEQELLNKAIDKHIALTPQQVAELKALAAEVARVEEETRRLEEIYDFGKSLTQGFFADLKSGLQESGNLWAALGEAGTKALDKIASKALDMAAEGIWDWLFSLGTDLLKTTFSTGGTSVTALPSAKGNVFSGPGIAAYSGSVVSSPTLFPFAAGVGLMGEAGPEAVLPLRRGADGKLGVSAGGGGAPTVVFNVTNEVSGAAIDQPNVTVGKAGELIVDMAVRRVEANMARGNYRSMGVGPGTRRV